VARTIGVTHQTVTRCTLRIGLIAASKPLGGCASGQVSKKRKAASTGENIRVARRLADLRAWVRLIRPTTWFTILLGVLAISMISACTAWSTKENTLDQISTLENIRLSQLLTTLSNDIDHPDSVPSEGVPGGGVATTSLTGTAGFTFTQPFDFAHNAKTLTPMASLLWQNNWSITPISDPQDLQNIRALSGLLYKTDDEIVQDIKDMLEVSQNKLSKDKYSKKDEKEGETWDTTSSSDDCGLTLNYEIKDPTNVLVSYFETLSAFPELEDENSSTKASSTKTSSTKTSSTKTSSTKTPEGERNPCYGPHFRSGLVNIGPQSLAQQYGLKYPTPEQVATHIRTGISPTCRRYQLPNIHQDQDIKDTRHISQQPIRGYLFTRWLFWKDANGDLRKPYPPPPGAPLEYLGKYGNHEFWTTGRACISDFIVIVINATANSHAVAVSSPKPGPTPALGQ